MSETYFFSIFSQIFSVIRMYLSSWKARTSRLLSEGRKKVSAFRLKWMRRGEAILAAAMTDRTLSGLSPFGKKLRPVKTNSEVTVRFSTASRKWSSFSSPSSVSFRTAPSSFSSSRYLESAVTWVKPLHMYSPNALALFSERWTWLNLRLTWSALSLMSLMLSRSVSLWRDHFGCLSQKSFTVEMQMSVSSTYSDRSSCSCSLSHRIKTEEFS